MVNLIAVLNKLLQIYNLLFSVNKQVAGVPGVTEALFVARQTALAQEKGQSSETPMLYSCGLCGKGYRSSKAHAEHLKSRNHIMRASQGTNNEEEDKAIVKPLPRRVVNKPPPQREVKDEESEESDWEEADPEEDLIGEATKSLTDLNVRELGSDNDMDEDDDDDDYEKLDPSSCFMCDLEHDTIESCMVHMHKQHGFFIPDVEYLKDPEGFLTYLGLKVLKHLPKFVLSRNLFLICSFSVIWFHIRFLSSFLFRSREISSVCTVMIGANLLTAWKQLGSIWLLKVIAKYILVMAMMRRKQSWKTFMIIAAGF